MNRIFHYISFSHQHPLASGVETLSGLRFVGQKYFLHKLVEGIHETKLPEFTQTYNWIDIYFSVKENQNPFRKTVYNKLLTVHYRQTMTYGEIARILFNR